MNENLESKITNDKFKNLSGKITFSVIVLIVLIGICFLIFKKLNNKKHADFNSVPSVNVTHIRKGSISKEVSVVGSVLPTDTYYVIAKVGGDIKKVNVSNGDYVKKGDIICEIDASKEIEAAYIQYNTTKNSYERMQKLYQAGDISLQNFEQIKAQYDAAKLAYDTKVEYSAPVAVADGIIENTNMIVNTTLSQGTVICYITAEGAKEINFGVTERVLSGIKLNDKVIIEKSGKKYEGYITNISNLISSQTGLFDIKAVITSENDFASGIMAKVTFPYLTKHNINILSNEFIYYEAGMPYVFVVNDDNTINKKYIEVGIENQYYSEVITKIDKSIKIVSSWNNDLAEGTIVKIVNDEPVEDEIISYEEEFVDNTNNMTNSTVEVASISEITIENKDETEIIDLNLSENNEVLESDTSTMEAE